MWMERQRPTALHLCVTSTFIFFLFSFHPTRDACCFHVMGTGLVSLRVIVVVGVALILLVFTPTRRGLWRQARYGLPRGAWRSCLYALPPREPWLGQLVMTETAGDGAAATPQIHKGAIQSDAALFCQAEPKQSTPSLYKLATTRYKSRRGRDGRGRGAGEDGAASRPGHVHCH